MKGETSKNPKQSARSEACHFSGIEFATYSATTQLADSLFGPCTSAISDKIHRSLRMAIRGVYA
jgi:hypothetical protein